MLSPKSLSRFVNIGTPKNTTKLLSSRGHSRCLSSLEQATNEESRAFFRTTEENPTFHTHDHVGRHYKIPDLDVKNVLTSLLRPQAKRMMDTFNENCLMVREPAIEVNSYLRNLNFSHPIPRFIYYGKSGAGKSTCLAMTMHHCYKNGWIIVHVPFAGKMMRVNEWHPKKEAVESSFKPGRYDVAKDAVEWLTLFRIQNAGKFKDLVTTHEYIWTKREKAEVGTPIDELINFGLTRFKFSSDVIGVVLKELREQASVKGLKVLLSVDAVNGLFVPVTTQNRIIAEGKSLQPHQLTMVHHFKKMLSPTWTGGAAVCTVKETANMMDQREQDTPKYLLQQQGFEWMDPFVPVLVPEYTRKESLSCINYYKDRNWIQNEYGRTEEGIKEILFVSNNNALNLARVCSSL